MAHPTIRYGTQELTRDQYVSAIIRDRDIRCDCGAAEQGHAPDCTFVTETNRAWDDFEAIVADATEAP